MEFAKIIFVSLFLMSNFISSRPAYADISPPPAPQLGGLEPFEYQNTNVQMLYERVEMELDSFFRPENPSFPQSRVNVTAYFTMRNQGDAPESMQVIFPMESFSNCRMGYGGGNSYTNYFVNEDSFRVLVNGASLPVEKVVTDHPDKDVPRLGEACSEMSWAGFDVDFPVDEDVVIRVEYLMESTDVDSMQNIEYILETGAGWAGPIQRGYVIVKFPYAATAENVLSDSTPGHQFLYNETYWSFEDLEPTGENNIQLSIVSPDIWQKILSLRVDLKENPRLPEKWLELAQIYHAIAAWHGPNVRNSYYYRKVPQTYEQGIASNPDHAGLYSNYARFIRDDCCYYSGGNIDEADLARMLSLVNQALALDPRDPTALEVVDFLRDQNPGLAFTPPATVLPTATPLLTSTPSITPSATMTPNYLADMPVVITVVHTKIVKVLASTATPGVRATATQKAVTNTVEADSGTNAEGVSGYQSLLSIAVIGMAATFLAGIIVAAVWFKVTKK